MKEQGMMRWRKVLNSVQPLAARSFLFSFTLLLVLKLDHVASCSWWIFFSPLWGFHAVVAIGRFSLPATSISCPRHWVPCHAIVAIPLLIAFELLLCIYLESFDGDLFRIVPINLSYFWVVLKRYAEQWLHEYFCESYTAVRLENLNVYGFNARGRRKHE